MVDRRAWPLSQRRPGPPSRQNMARRHGWSHMRQETGYVQGRRTLRTRMDDGWARAGSREMSKASRPSQERDKPAPEPPCMRSCKIPRRGRSVEPGRSPVAIANVLDPARSLPCSERRARMPQSLAPTRQASPNMYSRRLGDFSVAFVAGGPLRLPCARPEPATDRIQGLGGRDRVG